MFGRVVDEEDDGGGGLRGFVLSRNAGVLLGCWAAGAFTHAACLQGAQALASCAGSLVAAS